MAPQLIRILPRDGDGSKSGLYIAGFVIAGLIILGVVVCLTIRFLRQRARNNAEDNRGAAFLNVRGLVREDGEKEKEDALPKYGYKCSISRALFVIDGILTRILRPPTTVTSLASNPTCSQGPTLAAKELSCLAVLSQRQPLRNKKS